MAWGVPPWSVSSRVQALYELCKCTVPSPSDAAAASSLPPPTNAIRSISSLMAKLGKLRTDDVRTAPCPASVLYPQSGGNLRCFTSVSSCAVLDVLAPPYSEDAGRICTYFHNYPFSSLSAAGHTKVEVEVCPHAKHGIPATLGVWVVYFDLLPQVGDRTGFVILLPLIAV